MPLNVPMYRSPPIRAAIKLKANGFPSVKVMDGGIVMWPYGELGD